MWCPNTVSVHPCYGLGGKGTGAGLDALLSFPRRKVNESVSCESFMMMTAAIVQ